MGNSASSGRGHHEETVDFGYLTPQGVYTGPRDWNQAIAAQLICERKLAPFYRPLEDYDESWDDEQILAHRKEPQQPDDASAESSSTRSESTISISSRSLKRGHVSTSSKDITRHPEAAIYRGAVECPICFLYYPPNINHSRCCDQAICTECFVQIKRAEPNPTHLVSEPAACPYCVRDNFGVVYTPPPWRAGLGSEGATPPAWPDWPKQSEAAAAMKRPRKSFGADSPEVVTIDQVRPDWEAKLAAVRAAVARRANRRIIMRQVGDRLIPVGISSGRVHALPTEEGQAEGANAEGGNERGSRRRRRAQNQDINQLLGTMGLGGQDLEELMVMEAMRLSLIEHEEQQRRQREEEEKKKTAEGGDSAVAEEAQTEGAGPSTASEPQPEVPLATNDSTPPVTIAPPVLSPSTSPATAQKLLTPTNATQVIVPSPEDSQEASSPVTIVGIEGPNSSHGVSPTDLASSEAPSPQEDRVASRPTTPVSYSETNGDSLSAHRTGAMSIDRSMSYASSYAERSEEQSTYDMLSSSPESTVSHKPLLHQGSRPETPSVVEEGPMTA